MIFKTFTNNWNHLWDVFSPPLEGKFQENTDLYALVPGITLAPKTVN